MVFMYVQYEAGIEILRIVILLIHSSQHHARSTGQWLGRNARVTRHNQSQTLPLLPPDAMLSALPQSSLAIVRSECCIHSETRSKGYYNADEASNSNLGRV